MFSSSYGGIKYFKGYFLLDISSWNVYNNASKNS